MATVIGSLAFVVFAVASLAQVVVGSMLDRYGPRNVYMVVAAIQIVFFALMPGLTDGIALAVVHDIEVSGEPYHYVCHFG